MMEHDPITGFDDWYEERVVDDKGVLTNVRHKPCAQAIEMQYKRFKDEMDKRMVGMAPGALG